MKRRDVFRPGSEGDAARPPLNSVYKPGELSHSNQLRTTLEAFAPLGAQGNDTTIGARRMTLHGLLADPAFVTFLMTNNTFIQGKIGFHESILSLINDFAGPEPVQARTIIKQSQLPREVDGKPFPRESRVVLVPVVDSNATLNKLIAEALWRVGIVWLVAPLASIEPHLLLNFSTLFLPPERPALDALADVLPVDTVWKRQTDEDDRPIGYLVTKYSPLITVRTGKRIAVVPLYENN